jgi:uncharacterized protein YecT (DUF1311 family)
MPANNGGIKMRHLMLTSIVLFSGFAFADSKSDLAKVETDYNACLNSPEGQSNMGMKMCTGSAYDGADKILNEVYQKIVKAFSQKTGDKDSDDLSSESLRRLVASERAWITFRDTNSSLAGMDMYRGTGESLEIVSKAYDMTKARVNELVDMLGSY